MGVAEDRRDLEAVRHGLERWLSRHRKGPVEVGPLSRPNAGLSSETLLFQARSGGGAEALVARLPPAGGGIFPTYDLGLQARIQAALPALGVPTAEPVGFEEDPSYVGAPFLLMPHVPGRLLPDNPHFSVSGWLKDAGPDAQREAFAGVVDTMADLHRLDWEGGDLGFAARAGGPGLVPELAWWEAYLAWADSPAALGTALDWCRRQCPEPEPPPSLLWGDARLGNVIFGDDLRPAAVLDWEMTSVGPAEVDLGWFFAMREMATGPGRVELPGFLGRDETLDRYQARLGRLVGDLTWYEAFALLRSAAILARMQRLLVEQGQGDHWLVGFDPVPPRLVELTS